MIRGVLLDVDGTLVLSNRAHALSWVDAFKQFGYQITLKDVQPLIGMGGDKLIPKLAKDLNAESGQGKKISDYRSKIFLNEYATDLKPAPGSRALVEKLQSDGHKLVVASSASESDLNVLLKAAQVDDILKEATTSSDVNQSKPEPDLVHAALKKLNLRPEEALMIGDTPYDLEAAAQAQVGLVAVRCGGWKDQELAGAVAIYDDPADILSHYDSSPFSSSSLI